MSFWTAFYLYLIHQGFKNIIPHHLAHGLNQTSTHGKYHYPHNQGICSAE